MEERHVFRIVIYAMFVLFGFDHGCHSMKMVDKTRSCCIMCTFCISDATALAHMEPLVSHVRRCVAGFRGTIGIERA